MKEREKKDRIILILCAYYTKLVSKFNEIKQLLTDMKNNVPTFQNSLRKHLKEVQIWLNNI